MLPNTTSTAREKAPSETVSSGHSLRRRLIIVLMVLAFLAIGAIAVYAISLIVEAVTLLVLSALLAYLNFPLVRFLQHRLSHTLAIIVAYLLVASVLAVVTFIVIYSLIQQSSALMHSIQFLLSPAGKQRH